MAETAGRAGGLPLTDLVGGPIQGRTVLTEPGVPQDHRGSWRADDEEGREFPVVTRGQELERSRLV